jgi:hypothetical protein
MLNHFKSKEVSTQGGEDIEIRFIDTPKPQLVALKTETQSVTFSASHVKNPEGRMILP